MILSSERALAANERIALIIGNANYVEERSLANPHRDVDAMVRVLVDSLRFKREDITVRKDQPFQQLIADLKDFQLRAATAEIALIFYSGHGIAFNDANYIAPVDVPRQLVMTNTPADRVVHLDEVQNAVSGARVGLIFWDACRTNSVQASIDPKARQTSAARGLIPVMSGPIETNAVGTFISFATNPRQTADDGPQGGLSPFTAALTRRISTRGSSFMNVMGLVTGDVSAATGRTGRPQVPELRLPKITSAAVNFALLPALPEPARPQAASPSGGSGSSGGSGGAGSGSAAAKPKPASTPARPSGGPVGVAPGAGGGVGGGLF